MVKKVSFKYLYDMILAKSSIDVLRQLPDNYVIVARAKKGDLIGYYIVNTDNQRRCIVFNF